jgi:hypothetical protein
MTPREVIQRASEHFDGGATIYHAKANGRDVKAFYTALYKAARRLEYTWKFAIAKGRTKEYDEVIIKQ